MGCSLGAGVATPRAGSDRKPSAVDERRKNRARWRAATKRFRAEAGELQDRRRARPGGALHPAVEVAWHPLCGGEERLLVSLKPEDEDTVVLEKPADNGEDPGSRHCRELLPRILAAAPEAVLLVVTDPPDPLADLARVLAKHDRVLSTGTWLDSLRFQRYANIAIIEGSEASQYGIGMVSARMAEVELFDEREVLPVGSYSRRFGVTLSLPSVLESSGVREIFQPEHSITIRPAARRPLPAGSGELARDTAAEDRPGPIEARARSTVTLSRLRPGAPVPSPGDA